MEVTELNVVVDYSNIDSEIDVIYKDIDNKISDLEKRVKLLRDKEEILDKFIMIANTQFEATDSKNYKLRTQLQISISKQLETQQLITDTIIKYEKLIQDYLNQKHKMQNDKLSNYIKWKNANDKTADDNQLLETLKKFEEAIELVESGSGKSDFSDGSKLADKNALVQNILSETYDQGYKI